MSKTMYTFDSADVCPDCGKSMKLFQYESGRRLEGAEYMPHIKRWNDPSRTFRTLVNTYPAERYGDVKQGNASMCMHCFRKKALLTVAIFFSPSVIGVIGGLIAGDFYGTVWSLLLAVPPGVAVLLCMYASQKVKMLVMPKFAFLHHFVREHGEVGLNYFYLGMLK